MIRLCVYCKIHLTVAELFAFFTMYMYMPIMRLISKIKRKSHGILNVSTIRWLFM